MKKVNTNVDLTGYIIKHCNRNIMLSETIHGRLTLCTKSMLTGRNLYQREKVLQKLN